MIYDQLVLEAAPAVSRASSAVLSSVKVLSPRKRWPVGREEENALPRPEPPSDRGSSKPSSPPPPPPPAAGPQR
jgi:hypothetical protein